MEANNHLSGRNVVLSASARGLNARINSFLGRGSRRHVRQSSNMLAQIYLSSPSQLMMTGLLLSAKSMACG